MIDEMPLFVISLLELGRPRARTFLNWFRSVRIDPEVSESIRWLLCGSVGLDTVAERERLGDTINDLAIMQLGPFSSVDADRLLLALANSYDLVLEAPVRAAIIKRVGWLIPYHLQLIFSAIRDLDVPSPSLADVESAYAVLMDSAHRSNFDYWRQRLQDELGKIESGHALALLGAVAKDPQGVSAAVFLELLAARQADEEMLRYLLNVLDRDGYLVKADGRYHFRSPLLRDYWRAHVVL